MFSYRSDVEPAIDWIQSQNPDSYVNNLSRSAYLAMDPTRPVLSWEALAQKPCSFTSAFIAPNHDLRYDRTRVLTVAKSFQFKMKRQKLFSRSAIEQIEVLIFEKQCE